MPGSFLDTNVLVHVARREMRLSWAETGTLLSTLRALLTVTPLTLDIHLHGLALAERYKLSLYNAMIAAAALAAGCDRLWSKDRQHGLIIENQLRIENPFP